MSTSPDSGITTPLDIVSPCLSVDGGWIAINIDRSLSAVCSVPVFIKVGISEICFNPSRIGGTASSLGGREFLCLAGEETQNDSAKAKEGIHQSLEMSGRLCWAVHIPPQSRAP